MCSVCDRYKERISAETDPKKLALLKKLYHYHLIDRRYHAWGK